MGALSVGDVVFIRFPFSDLSGAKLRPAIVLACAGRDDWIMCQVTSNPYADERAISLEGKDFEMGSLGRTSFARPGKLFTANASIAVQIAGRINEQTRATLLTAVARLFVPG